MERMHDWGWLSSMGSRRVTVGMIVGIELVVGAMLLVKWCWVMVAIAQVKTTVRGRGAGDPIRMVERRRIMAI